MTLDDRIRASAEELQLIPERQERLAWVVEQAKRTPPLEGSEKNEANRVPGCVSAVWLVGMLQEGKFTLRADAESPLVRGLVLYVVRAYQGATPTEVLSSALDPLGEADLLRDLSPTRQNGLAGVSAQIRRWADQASR